MIMKGHAVFALLSQSPPAGSVSVPTDYRQPAVAWDAAEVGHAHAIGIKDDRVLVGHNR